MRKRKVSKNKAPRVRKKVSRGAENNVALTTKNPPGKCSTLEDLLNHADQVHAPVQTQNTKFELMLFFYLVTHLLIQNFNIYRMNFYHYNYYLLFLTMILLLKRILMRYWQQVKWENPFELSSPQIYLNLIIVVVIVSNSIYLMIQLFLLHPLKNFLFLFYPLISYFTLFGLGKKNTNPNSTDWIAHKLKGLAYSSFECGYYAGFLPLKFLQHDYLYFDTIRCALLVFYLFINSFVMLFAHLLASSFNELYLQSQIFGCWQTYKPPKDSSNRIQNTQLEEEPPTKNGKTRNKEKHKSYKSPSKEPLSTEPNRNDAMVWSSQDAPYPQGALVVHKGKTYIAVGALNYAEPGLFMPYFIYTIFGQPVRTHVILIAFQMLVVISQLALILNSRHWNIYAIMLLFNYRTLYHCIQTRRTNMTFWQHHKTKSAINNKTFY